MKNPLIPESVQSDLDLIANLPKASNEELFPVKPDISVPKISDPQEPDIATIQNYDEQIQPKYESVNLQTTPKEATTAEEAGLRARKVYEIAVKKGLPLSHVEKNLELYDNDAYDKMVGTWKQTLSEMSTGEQSAIMAFSGAGNLFGLTSYMSRKGWLFNEENRGKTSAFFDAVQQFHSEMNRPEITFGGTTVKLPSPAYVAGGVVKTGLEFMALPAIGTEKVTTWFGKMAENSAKFATQTAIQAPTIQEQGLSNNLFIKQRSLETLKSGLIGAGVGVSGKYIKNPFYRIPIVTGGFMTLTAIEGGTPEQILETGIQILGFEVLGMAQSAFRGKSPMQPVIEKAKEQVREFENVPDTEIEKILKTFADVPVVPEGSKELTKSVEATKQVEGANVLPKQEMPVGTAGVQPSRLSERVVDKLSKINNELKETLGDADESQRTSFSEQSELVAKLEAKDFEKLIRVGTGEEYPTGKFSNLLPNAAYVHLVNLADSTGNIELALRLKNSKVSLTSTRKGQDIVMLRNLKENSSVDVMSKVERAKEIDVDKKLQKKGTTLKAEKERMSNEMKNKIKEKPVKVEKFTKFIESIRCK